MVARLFAWLAGLALVMVFLVIVSPDILRGYIFNVEDRSPGRRTYETYCIGCHGENGEGDGEAAEFLNPKPRDFVNGEYKFFYFGEAGPYPSDASLAITIRNGVPGSAMPAFPLLSAPEVDDAIAYIKSLRAGGWEEAAPIQAASETVMYEGETGEDLFAAAGCNACHQLDVLGAVGGVGPNLSDVGARLSADEIAASVKDPDGVIAEDCPAGPCPAGIMPKYFSERLSPEQITALAEFLAKQQ